MAITIMAITIMAIMEIRVPDSGGGKRLAAAGDSIPRGN